MWETPFEEWMLELRDGVVVLCPTEEAFSEVAKILDKKPYQVWHRVGIRPSQILEFSQRRYLLLYKEGP